MGDNSFASINFNDPDSNRIFEEREKEMCSKWNTFESKGEIADVNILKKDNEKVFILNGILRTEIIRKFIKGDLNYKVKYWAANVPTYNTSFSGSGLPFPNENIAFDRLKNSGTAKINGEIFSFEIKHPNSYYKNIGTILVKPEVKIQVLDDDNKPISPIQVIKLGDEIPFRTLTWPSQRNWNNGPMFYYNPSVTVRSQYQILLDSAYNPNKPVPKNFWGTVPPH